MPVFELLAEMTYEEYLGWHDYISRRPIGWREDDRTFKLLQAKQIKAKPWEIFPSLKAVYEPNKPKAVVSEGSVAFQLMMNSSGGVKLAA